MIRPRPLTRRGALLLGVASGLSTLLARALPSAWALGSSEPRSFRIDLGADAFGPGGTTGVVRAPRRFDVVGVRGAALAGGLEIRVRRRGGAWSRWIPVHGGHDHRPDTGTGAQASDPIWAGGADELQLRAKRAPRALTRLHFVAVPAAAKRRGARAARAARARAAQVPGAPAIIPREAWGGDRVKPRANPSYGEVQVAFIHHTVSANDYGPQDSPGIVLGIAKYHRDTNGWNDIGYNFLVDKYGQIFEGRAGGIDMPVVGAQAEGWNAQSTGIANLGTFESAGQSEAAIDAMARLIAWKLPLHGVPVTGTVVLRSAGGSTNRYKSGAQVEFQRISGHRDGNATACPGAALYAQLPEIRRRAERLAPDVVPKPAATIEAVDGVTDVRYGEALALRGVVRRADGSPVAGQRVQIQKQGRSGSWVTVARADTDANGEWTAQVAWRATGRVRARANVLGEGVVVSQPLQATCVPVLEARVKTERVPQRGRVTLSGVVRPIGEVRITVERRGRDGRFRWVATRRVRPRKQRFTATVRLGRAGLYRVRASTGSGGAQGKAAAIFVRAVRGR